MPLLTLGFFCLRESYQSKAFFLDRDTHTWSCRTRSGNISNAITDNLMEDASLPLPKSCAGFDILIVYGSVNNDTG